jgi:hypothetical protein
MNVIVGESLILTYLAQRRVLEEALRLPHEMVVPDVMLVDTLLDLGSYDRKALLAMGARVGYLDGDGVELARAYQADYAALSTTETFALVLAEAAGEAAILLSGEVAFRRAAESHGLQVRGLSWILDEMNRHGMADIERLRTELW